MTKYSRRFLAKVDNYFSAIFAYSQSNIHVGIISQNQALIHPFSTLVDVEHCRHKFARGKPQAANTMSIAP